MSMRATRHDKAKIEALIKNAEVYGEAMSTTRTKAYMDVISDISLDDLEWALTAHKRDPERGRYFPMPADLFGALRGRFNILTRDEAWAIAELSFDEGASVVWSFEIEEARNIAKGLWDSGDKIGASLCFKASYTRLSDQTRPPRWKVSLGHDQEDRIKAVNRAMAMQLITDKQARNLLASPTEADPQIAEVTGLLAGKVVPIRSHERRHVGNFRRAVASGIMQAKEAKEAEEAPKKAPAE